LFGRWSEVPGYRDQRGRQVIEINYRNGVFTLVTSPNDGYFRAMSVRQLSNIEDFDITRSFGRHRRS
jgi:hypothetical protein